MRRIREDDPKKYINTNTTPVFTKGDQVYGWPQAPDIRAAACVYIVEGNVDLLQLIDKGIGNVVAPLGTALTSEQLAKVHGLNPVMVLAFDGDPAGRKSIRHVLEADLAGVFDLSVILLPPGQDPDDVVKNGGRAAWEQVATHRVDRWTFLFDEIKRAAGDLATVAARVTYKDEILAEVRKIHDPAIVSSFVHRLAVDLDLDPTALFDEYHLSAMTIRAVDPRDLARAADEQLLAAAAYYWDSVPRDLVTFATPVVAQTWRHWQEAGAPDPVARRGITADTAVTLLNEAWEHRWRGAALAERADLYRKLAEGALAGTAVSATTRIAALSALLDRTSLL
jgi:DNA primase